MCYNMLKHVVIVMTWLWLLWAFGASWRATILNMRQVSYLTGATPTSTASWIRCDFPAAEDGDELKRAYKRRSLQFHPDKPGGWLPPCQH